MAATATSRRAIEMPTRTAAAARTTREILAELFGPPARRTFAVRLWDGTIDEPGVGRDAAFTLVLRRPGALRRMFLPPRNSRSARPTCATTSTSKATWRPPPA